MIALVGYTGFVGSNIIEMAGNKIDALYNSQNIADAYGTEPDLLIYAGLRAEKYLANSAPEKDMELICQAEENIRKIAPKRLVLISTIDVFKIPRDVDENSEVDTEGLQPYGYNRYQLELWVREHYPDALIIRLPGLFGKNIKKNFIYDYMNVIPFMLKESVYIELSRRDVFLKQYYLPKNNGYYQVCVQEAKKEELREHFLEIGFSALNFTDSRSKFQFYNLARLWDDIRIALAAGLTLWHPATEPVSAGELHYYLTGSPFVNELNGFLADYDCKTRYCEIFGGSDKYIESRENIMMEIADFIKKESETHAKKN